PAWRGRWQRSRQRRRHGLLRRSRRLRCPAWRCSVARAVRQRRPARPWWFLLRRIRPSSAWRFLLRGDRWWPVRRGPVAFGLHAKAVFFQGRAVAPGCRCSVLGRGLGPAFLCCLVGLPLTLTLSPEGRGDGV